MGATSKRGNNLSKLNLESIFGDAELDMDCPGCNRNFKVKYKQLSKSGNKVRCPHCREDIKITHDNKTKREISKADKELNKLDKSLKKFGK